MNASAQSQDMRQPTARALLLPALTTVGLLAAYAVMRLRVLPLLLDTLRVDTARTITSSPLPPLGSSHLWATTSADAGIALSVLVAALWYRHLRQHATPERVARSRALLNTVNVLLVVCVALMISGVQSAAQWRGETRDNSYEFIRGRLATLDSNARCDALTRILVNRLEQDELETSEEYGRALLAALPPCERTFRDYGFAAAKANQVVGHFALQRHDLPAALQALAAAGSAPASPALAARGPGTALAASLLKAGERDAVLRYLESIQTQWPKGRHRIELWMRDVRRGRMPQADFGKA